MTPALDVTVPLPLPLVVLCAWCPGWNRHAPENKGASHGVCEKCLAIIRQQMLAGRS